MNPAPHTTPMKKIINALRLTLLIALGASVGLSPCLWYVYAQGKFCWTPAVSVLDRIDDTGIPDGLLISAEPTFGDGNSDVEGEDFETWSLGGIKQHSLAKAPYSMGTDLESINNDLYTKGN